MDSSSGAALLPSVLSVPKPPPSQSGRWGRQGVVLTPFLGTYQYPAPKAFPLSPSPWLVSSEKPTRGGRGGRNLPLPASSAVGPAAAAWGTRLPRRRSLRVEAAGSSRLPGQQGSPEGAGPPPTPRPSPRGAGLPPPAAAPCGRDGPAGAEVTLRAAVAAAAAAAEEGGGGAGGRGEPAGWWGGSGERQRPDASAAGRAGRRFLKQSPPPQPGRER